MTEERAAEALRTLTVAECRVLHWVCKGLSIEQIADQLVVAKTTVNFHIANIYTKLALKDLTRSQRRLALGKLYCPIVDEEITDPEKDCVRLHSSGTQAAHPGLGSSPEEVSAVPDQATLTLVTEDEEQGMIPLQRSLVVKKRDLPAVGPLVTFERKTPWWVYLLMIVAGSIGGAILMVVALIMMGVVPGMRPTPTSVPVVSYSPTLAPPVVNYSPTPPPANTLQPTPTVPPTYTPAPTYTPPPTYTTQPVIVVVVTATPVPQPMAPPTATPVPAPISLDTPAGSVLSVGQYWRQEDVGLVLKQVAFDPEYSCVATSFDLDNYGRQDIVTAITLGQFTAVDNTGRAWVAKAISLYTYCRYQGGSSLSQLSVVIGAGDSFWQGGYTAWYISLEGPLSDSRVTSLTVTVNGLSRVRSAKWLVTIGR